MGSGIDLADRGLHELKGAPGGWPLFRVQRDGRQDPAFASPSVAEVLA